MARKEKERLKTEPSGLVSAADCRYLLLVCGSEVEVKILTVPSFWNIRQFHASLFNLSWRGTFVFNVKLVVPKNGALICYQSNSLTLRHNHKPIQLSNLEC